VHLRSFCINVVLSVLVFSFFISNTFASTTDAISIFAVSRDLAGFHQFENQIRHYEDGNVWKVSIVPFFSDDPTPIIFQESGTAFTIIFSTLEELLHTVAMIAHTSNRQIAILNIHAHGLPGGQGFPRDLEMLRSWRCKRWRDRSKKPEKSFAKYYQLPSFEEISDIRQWHKDSSNNYCLSTSKDWRAVSERLYLGDLRRYFSKDAQINLLSCLVGYGTFGDLFLKNLAALLLPVDGNGRVSGPINFGLADSSMYFGLGFWDYKGSRQLTRDKKIYSKTKQDFRIAQSGTLRVAEPDGKGGYKSRTIKGIRYWNFSAAQFELPN